MPPHNPMFHSLLSFEHRTGRYKTLILIGPAVSALGYLLLILRWHGRTNIAELMYIVIGEFGNAISQSTGIIGLMAGVDTSDIAVAGTGFAQSQSIGVIIGLTLTMTTLQSSLRPMLTRHLQDVPNSQTVRIPEDRSSSSARN